MIVNQELVKRIKDYFNLNIYETKVWLALLSKGIASAGEVAELSGVPRSRTYDVLESLAKRGFAIVKIGKPVKYIAIDPKTVIEKMKSNVLNDAQERVKTLSELKETSEYGEIATLFKTGITPIRAEDLSGHLKGRANVISKIKELFDIAEKEISICTSNIDFEDKVRILLPAIEKKTKENVKIKIALSGDKEAVKRINTKHGIKAKYTENPGKFYIADKKQTLFMINSESSDEDIGVWLNSQSFSNTLAGMFDSQLRK